MTEWMRFIGPKGPQHMISFPRCCHYEENRQNIIDIGNWNHRTGWLPCGDNWWVFKKKVVHRHEVFNDVYVVVQGSKKRLVSE